MDSTIQHNKRKNSDTKGFGFKSVGCPWKMPFRGIRELPGGLPGLTRKLWTRMSVSRANGLQSICWHHRRLIGG